MTKTFDRIDLYYAFQAMYHERMSNELIANRLAAMLSEIGPNVLSATDEHIFSDVIARIKRFNELDRLWFRRNGWMQD